jgi:hypothetical protein
MMHNGGHSNNDDAAAPAAEPAAADIYIEEGDVGGEGTGRRLLMWDLKVRRSQ